jgi:hypothetical protein
MSIIFDRKPNPPKQGRWYFLKNEEIPTGQINVWWVQGPEHGRIEMSASTGAQCGVEDLRQVSAAQRQAIDTGLPVKVVAYDRQGIVDPIRQTITMMQDTLHQIGKNGGRIDPLSFSACQQSMSRLRALMDEAQETYNLLAEAYVAGDEHDREDAGVAG